MRRFRIYANVDHYNAVREAAATEAATGSYGRYGCSGKLICLFLESEYYVVDIATVLATICIANEEALNVYMRARGENKKPACRAVAKYSA